MKIFAVRRTELRIGVAAIAATLLAACGSISEIQSPTGEGNPSPLVGDLSDYERISVLDFSDATKNQGLPEFVGRNFADRIAAQLRSTGAFLEVSRQTDDGQSLVVEGEITRYAEGSGAMRVLIGFGAGSSYFDANVRFRDSNNGQTLGTMIVDKNSWALGGIIAGTQTGDSFLNEAAKKIAKELAEARSTRAC